VLLLLLLLLLGWRQQIGENDLAHFGIRTASRPVDDLNHIPAHQIVGSLVVKNK